MKAPLKSRDIWDRLSAGKFITKTGSTSELYQRLEDDTEMYNDYFEGIGYHIEHRDGYFYFTEEDTRASVQDKLSSLVKYLLCYDLLLKMDTGLICGNIFSRRRMIDALENNADVRKAGEEIVRKYISSATDYPVEKIADSVIDFLQEKGFVEEITKGGREYILTEATDYLGWFLDHIDLEDEEGEETYDEGSSIEQILKEERL